MSETSLLTCCICGKEFLDRTGNNPWPVVDDDTGEKVCCHACNATVVIPARLKLAREQRETEATDQ